MEETSTGPRFLLSMNLPPKEQYEKGGMLIVRANSKSEFGAALDELADLGKVQPLIQAFLDHQVAAVKARPSPTRARKGTDTRGTGKGLPLPPKEEPKEEAKEAVLNLKKELGATEESGDGNSEGGPTAVQRGLAKRFGVKVDGMSREEASAAIKKARGVK